MIEEVKDLNAEDQRLVMDAPVWISLLAAYKHDGVIDEEERSAAIKQTHYRSFSGTRILRHYFDAVDDHFEERFDAINATLPTDFDEREAVLEENIKNVVHAINKLTDKSFAKKLLHDLNSIFEYVFKSTSNFFQYFAFPIISAELQKEISEELGK